MCSLRGRTVPILWMTTRCWTGQLPWGAYCSARMRIFSQSHLKGCKPDVTSRAWSTPISSLSPLGRRFATWNCSPRYSTRSTCGTASSSYPMLDCSSVTAGFARNKERKNPELVEKVLDEAPGERLVLTEQLRKKQGNGGT